MRERVEMRGDNTSVYACMCVVLGTITTISLVLSSHRRERVVGCLTKYVRKRTLMRERESDAELKVESSQVDRQIIEP